MLEAIKALGECGPDAKIAIRYLILVLGNHREESIVNAVIKSLGKIGKDAVPHLIKALKDKRVLVQIGAANALGMMGRFAANAIPALTANLSHKNPHVRKAVEDALDRIR
jgi:HEAT repeat protein